MAQKIHYQDDIYFIHRIVRTVRDALKIEIDPDYYAARILSDVRFANEAMRNIRDSLMANTRIVERPEYLKLLLGTATDLTDIVSDLSSGSSDLGRALEGSKDELQAMYQSLRGMTDEIRNSLNELVDGEMFDVEVVSRDELSELLQS
ncbi:MAG: hypothetical protein NT080_13835 [Spirochaetes bacterium]|nr:hypothetical protein [Spirochaetota bacterium]